MRGCVLSVAAGGRGSAAVKDEQNPRGILIIEGGDGAGKTTLAESLRRRFGARYLHSTRRKDIWKWHTAALDLACRLAERHLVLLDRHWVSEQVYGAVFRGAPGYDAGARSVDRVLQKHGAVYVLCVPSDPHKQLDRHRQRAAAGREMFGNIERVVARYADLLNGNTAHPGNCYLDQLIRAGDFARRPDVVTYDLDTDGRDLNAFGDRLLQQLRRYRGSQHPLINCYEQSNFTGHTHRADFVFVGEQASPRSRWPHWPFYDRDDHLSAATYLNRALHTIAFDETRAVWFNAQYPNSVFVDGVLARQLCHDRRAIAFGEVADSYLTGCGISHLKLPHPQHWRRFRYSELSTYANLIREGLR